MKALNVVYAGWGERWTLGRLADNGLQLLFEYSAEALSHGLELSPLNLPLRAEAYGGFARTQQRLPGLFADSLPDGWGRVLMEKVFRQVGLEPSSVSPLDRLAWIGDRGLGALVFEPANPSALPAHEVQLLTLAQQVREVISGRGGEVLRELAALGGSPQGARPKALVYYDPAAGSVSSAPQPNHRPWLVKFPSAGEHKEVCAIEAMYAELARSAGLEVPVSRAFELDRTLAAFAIERFDVAADCRVPILTLAGALDADFRLPSAVDYSTLLRVTRLFSRDEREVKKAYARAVFNVVFHNRDDHAKNVSFRLGRDRQWRLAPAYDLTFSQGLGGEHQMDVCGEGRAITRAHLLRLAREGGLDTSWAEWQIDAIVAVAVGFQAAAAAQPLRKVTVATLSQLIAANVARVRQA
ncbi:MAG: type II toxin-antitoxin system HipA family toxin [Proteobacteria bacterium]|nr:type II toxin-antitoxin system HipA family toxin [Pseudomonadota bacterium]